MTDFRHICEQACAASDLKRRRVVAWAVDCAEHVARPDEDPRVTWARRVTVMWCLRLAAREQVAEAARSAYYAAKAAHAAKAAKAYYAAHAAANAAYAAYADEQTWLRERLDYWLNTETPTFLAPINPG
jgi:hypothetical protein